MVTCGDDVLLSIRRPYRLRPLFIDTIDHFKLNDDRCLYTVKEGMPASSAFGFCDRRENGRRSKNELRGVEPN